MPGPSYDEATLKAYFCPPDPSLYEDPIVGPVLLRLNASDPDVIEAVTEVDRSQIREALRLSPEQRLTRAFGAAETLGSFGRVAR